MPLYEYECRDCGQRTEIIQRFDDAPLAACPECGGAVQRLISAPAVQFKGTGWYVTDYGGRKPAAETPAKSPDKDSGDKPGGSGEPPAKKAAGAGKEG